MLFGALARSVRTCRECAHAGPVRRCGLNDGAGAVIAVVDDQPSVRTSLARLLRSADLTPARYTSGQEFLDSLNDGAPECVILGLRMPGLDGFEVLAQLARRDLSVPVIVLTSYPSDEARERALAEGVVAFLTKPVDRTVLLEAVARAIGTRKEIPDR